MQARNSILYNLKSLGLDKGSLTTSSSVRRDIGRNTTNWNTSPFSLNQYQSAYIKSLNLLKKRDIGFVNKDDNHIFHQLGCKPII